MPARLRIAVFLAGGLLVALGLAWNAGVLPIRPRLEPSPEAIDRGRAFVQGRCLQCHATIALAPRVAGWSVRRAYETVGRLPEVNPAMPRFPGSEDDRRAVAAYLAALGAGRAAPP